MDKSIHQIILDTVINNNMLNSGDNVVVGVSGGADSMCLLHFLMSVKDDLGISIKVAHINHNLRGDEAMRDQVSVQNFCEQHNLNFNLLSVDINKISQDTGESCEECGRRIRYEFFNSLCNENSKIATAHTLSDCCETVLFNTARGTGLKGLTGIPKVRDNIIRPLINITRFQVEEYCKENNIQYVIDSTNLENDYNRNKIRNIAIPVMREINPSFEKAILRLENTAQEYIDLADSLANDLLKKAFIKTGYRCDVLRTTKGIVLKQAIIKIMNNAGCSLYEEKHINIAEKIIKQCNGSLNLPNGFTCSASQGIFRVYSNDKNTVRNMAVFPKNGGTVVINNQKIKVEIISKQRFDEIRKINKLLVKNAVDYDIIHFETLFRTRKVGDKFSMYGRGVTKTLKKLFIEEKIPSEMRGDIVVLANDNEILWIDNIGVSEKSAVKEHTKKVAVIYI